MSKEAMKLAFEALETYYGYMEPLTTVFGGPRVPAEQSTTGKVETAITSLRQAIAEFDSHTLYREGYVNGYAFGEAAGRKAVAEKQDGACQHCAGKGCVACDARKVTHDVF